MAISGVNNNNYYSYVSQNNGDIGKAYSNVRDYKAYLSEKYECMKNSNYSVEINSSLLAKATSDEKTSKWLEYNLSLIPKVVDNLKSSAAACGSKVISCNICINGYDNITTEMVGKFEDDPGIEKARKELEKKKAEEKKAEERRMGDEKLEELRLDENVKLPSDSDTAIVDNMMRGYGFDQKI